MSMAGCGSVSKQQKAILATVAASAKERAAAFSVVKPLITASNAEHVEAVNTFLDAHEAGLNAQAVGSDYLVKAVADGSGLSSAAREVLIAEAATAAARAENLKAITPHLKVSADVAVFLKTHQDSLDSQAAALRQLAALVQAQKSSDD
jgi:hypothetical protein